MSTDNRQESLFYEDIYEATDHAIASTGKQKKEIAANIYPGRNIETAKSLLTRALSPENSDVHYTVEMMLAIMAETRPEDVLYFLCDHFGFDRPARKDKESFERTMKKQVRVLVDSLMRIQKDLKNYEAMK